MKTTFDDGVSLALDQRTQERERGNGGKPSGTLDCVRLADVEPKPITWLMPEKFALGKISVLAGDPNLGKSLITTAIVGHVTTGRPWPDGRNCPHGSAILLSAEDSPADTVRPRMDAAEADVSRVHIIRSVYIANDNGVGKRGFELKQDLKLLSAMLDVHRECKLVVVDPISAFMTGVNTHRNSEVRGALMALEDLAQERNISVLGVMHLNKKSGGTNALYRVQESGGFTAAPRGVYMVAKDPDDEDRRLILHAKNNLSRDTTGLAYRINTALNGQPYITWESDTITMTADEAFAEVDADEKTAVDDAAQWLLDELKLGCVETVRLQKLAKDSGHTWISVRRAKTRLRKRVGVIKKTGTGKWAWVLLADKPQGDQGDQGDQE